MPSSFPSPEVVFVQELLIGTHLARRLVVLMRDKQMMDKHDLRGGERGWPREGREAEPRADRRKMF
jgi:hypothetical protein